MITNTLNRRAAKAAGYRPLTERYRLPDEQPMLDGVVADMRRGNISHVLVKDRAGVEVWRRGCRPGCRKSEVRNSRFGAKGGRK